MIIVILFKISIYNFYMYMYYYQEINWTRFLKKMLPWGICLLDLGEECYGGIFLPSLVR